MDHGGGGKGRGDNCSSVARTPDDTIAWQPENQGFMSRQWMWFWKSGERRRNVVKEGEKWRWL